MYSVTDKIYLKKRILFTGNIRHLALSGPTNIHPLHYGTVALCGTDTLKLFPHTVIFILGVTIHKQ